MIIEGPEFKFLDEIDGVKMLKNIERIARYCYKSEDRITDDSYIKMIQTLIKNRHLAMLEHEKVSVWCKCDRGVSHELVRHRIASYAQESTRYCNYSKDNFGRAITYIDPFFFKGRPELYALWKMAVQFTEDTYLKMIEIGATAQEARSVLINSTKTEIIITMNLREWLHFFELRYVGTTGSPHPQMKELTSLMITEFKKAIPIVFDNIVVV